MTPTDTLAPPAARPAPAPAGLAAGLLAALDQHAIVSVADAAGRILYVNQRFCEVSGYAEAELLGANHRLLKSGLHDAAMYAAMWRQIASGRTWRGELCNRRRSGELYWVEATIMPELDAAGRPLRYVSVRTDITAAKQAQRRAEVAEDRYRRSQDFGNIGTWDLDLRSGELYWSERIAPLFGYPVGELATSYENFVNAVHPDDRQAVLDAVQASIDTGARYELEHRCVWPDGSVRWLLERGDVIRDAGGTPQRMLGVVQDITERKQAQAGLTLFRQAVESSGEGVALARAGSGRIRHLNPAARRILGWGDEVLGQPGVERIPAHAQADFIEAAQRAMRGQPAHIDFSFTRPDGSQVPLRNTLTPVFDETGAVSHIVNVFGDRSEEIARQRELQDALGQARRANRAKAEFMSRMSHELRTPLNAILGFAQVLLMRSDLPPVHADSVDEILRAGKHLLALIDEVLDIARIDLGRLRVSLEPVDLADVARQALALVEPMATKAGVMVRLELDTGWAVQADFLRLKQCLINLLSNAVKYNRPGGWVRLRALEDGPARVRIEVEDDGLGVSPQEVGQLFRDFSRLDRHRDHADGVGIGLAITHQLVGLMQGEIGVRSEPGQGSVFWIALPRAEPRRPDRGPATGFGGLDLPDPARRASRRELLYVEDNPANLKLVRSMLRLLPDVHVLVADTAASGLALAREACPDLILLDIGLPGMDGFELLAALRREPALARTPVIAVSANAMPADVARGLAAGFQAYLTKPIDVHELLGRVKRALALSTGTA